MPKIIKGGPFELLEIQFVTKYQKNEPVKNKQIFSKKKSHGAEKRVSSKVKKSRPVLEMHKKFSGWDLDPRPVRSP